mmetsp:Transcript_112731/g.318613  ORF Transcript_112731/g.318613 Transcript_112731/m.318613 type:complete len:206 (-) Transcript_112731:19-636(-)
MRYLEFKFTCMDVNRNSGSARRHALQSALVKSGRWRVALVGSGLPVARSSVSPRVQPRLSEPCQPLSTMWRRFRGKTEALSARNTSLQSAGTAPSCAEAAEAAGMPLVGAHRALERGCRRLTWMRPTPRRPESRRVGLQAVALVRHDGLIPKASLAKPTAACRLGTRATSTKKTVHRATGTENFPKAPGSTPWHPIAPPSAKTEP